MNKNNCKELLIDVATRLINEFNGDVSKVTIREISSISGVSVGLINYHFGNKENLITICVQKIISGVVHSFKPNLIENEKLDQYNNAKERLKFNAKRVFQFLFTNKAISKISILNDYHNYTDDSNSSISMKAMASLITSSGLSKEKVMLICFNIVNSMQIAFLKSFTEPIFLSYDMTSEDDRNRFIDDLIENEM